MSSAIATLSHFDFNSLYHNLEASVEDFTWPRLDLLDSFQPLSPEGPPANNPDGADGSSLASVPGHDDAPSEGIITAQRPRYRLAPPAHKPATSDSNPTQPDNRATSDASANPSPTAGGASTEGTASDDKATSPPSLSARHNAVPKENKSDTISPEEKRALEQEQRQRELLRVEEIYTKMRVERELHEAKMQAILANLETEVQRIWNEVILRRQKLHADLLEKWEKVMLG